MTPSQALLVQPGAIDGEPASQAGPPPPAEQAPQFGSWEWDIVANEVRWSNELYRIFGLVPQQFEATFEGYQQLVHPDDLGTVLHAISVSQQTGRPFAFEHRILRPGGSVRFLYCRGEVVINADGDPIRMFGLAQDITDHKAAEEEAALVHSIATTVGEADDLEGALVTVLRTVCERAGWPLGRVWLAAPDRSRLVAGPVWHVTDARLAHLDGAVRPDSVRLGEGIPGRVWSKRKAVWLAAIGPDATAGTSDPLVAVGLISCMAFPVIAHGEVEAVFEFFVFELREEDAALVRFAETISAVIGSNIRRKRIEDALRASEEKFRNLLEGAPDAMVIVAEDGRIELVNSQTEILFGYERQELLGRREDILLSPRCHGELRAKAEALLGSASPAVVSGFDLMAVRKDGTEFPVEASLSPLRTDDGVLVSAAIRDVTQRKRADNALREAHDGLAALVNELESQNREIKLFNEMSDLLQSCISMDEAGAVVTDTATKLFSSGAGAMYLASASGVLEAVATWGLDRSGPQRSFSPEQCWAFRRGRVHAVVDPDGLLRCPHVADHEAHVCVPLMAYGEALGVLHWRPAIDPDAGLFEPGRRSLVATAEHLSLAIANFRLREALRDQSARDALTGLYNRRQVEKSISRLVAGASDESCVGVIMIDVDGLKTLNDTLGHEAGDEMLRALARILAVHVRAEDMAARYGGDEFTLVLADAPLEVTLRRAEEVREAVAKLQIATGQMGAPVTVSLGVAAFPQHGSTSAELVRAADRALYQAKLEGRNRTGVARAESQAVSDLAIRE